ncbi:LysM peptidoglycan-binding domain-containing protein [Oceanibium sediminis]|uniref:LysM peptidoglycan-binding domain-containing protein n=1 Tax=Oceanibium sediminis TaxID=2026339 RepID=UPI000DD317DE|nr:LysM peptidoglycan-binding domain-containing protein [Oceanibium sediminis]
MSDQHSPESNPSAKPKRRLIGPGTILAAVVLVVFVFGFVQVVNRMPGLTGRFAPNEPPQITVPPEAPATATAPTSAPETGSAEQAAASPEPDSAGTAPDAGESARDMAVEAPADDAAPAEPEFAAAPSEDSQDTAQSAPKDAGAPVVEPEPGQEAASAADTTAPVASGAPSTGGTPAEAGEGAAPAAPGMAEVVAIAPAPEVSSDDAAGTALEEAAAPTVATPETPVEAPDAATVETAAAPDATAAEAEGDDAPAAAMIEPTFDIIRIDATGAGLVAGRAEPGATVEIFAGGTEPLARVEASLTGEFVAFIQTPRQDEGQVLSLSAALGASAVASEQTMLVLPTDSDTDEAPLIVSAEAGEVRVVQPSVLGKVDGVTLDTISYDEAGAVKLAGRAAGDGPIRIYMDGAPVGAAEASAGGTWDATLDAVKEGRYILRIDALNADGSVSSRAESPFQRVFLTDAQRANRAQITVQPGNTLWVMARDRYGSGFLYTQIFQANSDAIRDPDLIYPGQIFTLPAEEDFQR